MNLNIESDDSFQTRWLSCCFHVSKFDQYEWCLAVKDSFISAFINVKGTFEFLKFSSNGFTKPAKFNIKIITKDSCLGFNLNFIISEFQIWLCYNNSSARRRSLYLNKRRPPTPIALRRCYYRMCITGVPIAT